MELVADVTEGGELVQDDAEEKAMAFMQKCRLYGSGHPPQTLSNGPLWWGGIRHIPLNLFKSMKLFRHGGENYSLQARDLGVRTIVFYQLLIGATFRSTDAHRSGDDEKTMKKITPSTVPQR